MNSRHRKIHLGIHYYSYHEWTAYKIYIKNLIYAINQIENPPNITILTRDLSDINFPVGKNTNIIKIPKLINLHFKSIEILNGIVEKMNQLFESIIADVFCFRNKIDALFSVTALRPFIYHKTPWISWIPDFQHIHFPEYFSNGEIQKRNKVFKESIKNVDCILLSSISSMNDLLKFNPGAKQKSTVAQFVTQIETGLFENNPVDFSAKYNLPEKFFFLPSQFWIHKNHKTVISALEILRETNPNIVVVCSGSVVDYRNPELFSEILKKLSEKNLRNNFIVLGLIPYSDVQQLMRQSCAVLQPSIFEGWSTIVEEAKSLGKMLLLSDIPIHREQNPKYSLFFDPTSSKDLSEKMIKVFISNQPGPTIDREKDAQKLLRKRTIYFGKKFMEAVYIALNSKR